MSSTILGILASSGAAATGTASFESIQTYTVGAGGITQIDFNTIDGTYKHLQIRALVKTASSGDGLRLRMNGDSGANYTYHLLYGTGAAVGVGQATGITLTTVGDATYSGTNAYTFAGNVIDILDYSSANKYKTVKGICGYDLNGSGDLRVSSGLWMTTTAVTSLSFFNGSGVGDFQQYSTIALYGMKGN